MSMAAARVSPYVSCKFHAFASPRGQSSPGTLQSGQQPLNAMRQMPQLSSLATQCHVATPIHLEYIRPIYYPYTDPNNYWKGIRTLLLGAVSLWAHTLARHPSLSTSWGDPRKDSRHAGGNSKHCHISAWNCAGTCHHSDLIFTKKVEFFKECIILILNLHSSWRESRDSNPFDTHFWFSPSLFQYGARLLHSQDYPRLDALAWAWHEPRPFDASKGTPGNVCMIVVGTPSCCAMRGKLRPSGGPYAAFMHCQLFTIHCVGETSFLWRLVIQDIRCLRFDDLYSWPSSIYNCVLSSL